MKILFVSSGNKETGISPIVESQGITLRNIGIELEFFSIEGKGYNSYLKCVLKLRKHLRNNRYDIIHAHYGLSGIVSFLARNKEKLIVSFMGDDILGSNNQDGSYRMISKLFVRINLWLSRDYYDSVIVKSAEMSGKVKLVNKCNIVPNGVDMNVFRELEQTDCRKKLDWDIDIIHVLFPSNPTRAEKNFYLAESAIKRLAGNYRISLHTLTGIQYEMVPVYLNAANLVLLTSFHEGSPNVIKEAMACNCPVVSSDVGDVRWVIGSTEGCYITSFEPTDVSEKIIRSINFSKIRHKTNGRTRIKDLGIDSDTTARKIKDIYAQLMQEKN
ncbi:MAG TPA: glycosyltransferase family 4 protein [Bacteroidales bacterium]|nr:glycosyltransferase family 4 protein [Bacteroidales bacterium]